MSIIDDLKTAVDAYENDACKIEIVNYSFDPNQGRTLNTEETFRFDVKVTNAGELIMNVVKVRVNGTSYADVALSSGVFGNSAVAPSAGIPIFPEQSVIFSGFRGRTKTVTPGNVAADIVTAQIYSWDANLEHILLQHTGAGKADAAKLSKVIAPRVD